MFNVFPHFYGDSGMGRINKFFVVLLLIILYSSLIQNVGVYADRGGIPSGNSYVDEPGQYAVISWCNGLETLYLSTYIESESPVYMLEILPLPSIPQISLGNKSVFKSLALLVSKRSKQYGYYEYYGYEGFPKGSAPGANREGIEILLTFSAGPHNVTVVRANNSTQLLDTLKVIADQNGFSIKENLEKYYKLPETVNNYISNGYKFFAIDIIYVEKAEGTLIEPIVYTFRSDKIYYPMEISAATYSGFFDLHLFIITTFPINEDYFEEYASSYAIWSLRIIKAPVMKHEIENMDPKLVSIFPIWIQGLYLNYVYMHGDYFLIRDIEIPPDRNLADYFAVFDFIILAIFLLVILKYPPVLNEKQNYQFITIVLALILAPIIITLPNLSVMMIFPIFSHYLFFNTILMIIPLITLIQFTKASIHTRTFSFSPKFKIIMEALAMLIICYIIIMFSYILVTSMAKFSPLYTGVLVTAILIWMIIIQIWNLILLNSIAEKIGKQKE